MDILSEFILEKKLRKNEIGISILVIPLIILAVVLNQISQRTEIPLINRFAAISRSLIYFGLFISWGLSVRRRVMQKQVRRYLTAISSLMVFWLLIRTVKYFFVLESLRIFRYLWYSYYIPELLIVLMSLFTALSLGKSEDYKLPKYTKILYIPTLALIGLVFTNDHHQIVFRLTDGIMRNTVSYKHNIGFWLVFTWLITCALISIIIVLIKSKVPGGKRTVWLPFIAFLIAIIYTLMYVFWFPVIKKIFNDMTIVLCLSIMGVFETCIYTGLIRSNKYYNRLFYASSIGGIIVDKNYNIYFKSKGARPLSIETLRLAENKSIDLDGDTRLSSLPITGGHALWLEDVSEINSLLSQLEEIGERLSENNDLLQAELELKERVAIVEERDKLYNKVIKEIGIQLESLDNLLLDKNNMDIKEKIIRLCILGAYIKRRSNLVILNEEQEILQAKELEYSFRESTEAMSQCSIDCFFIRNCEGEISTIHGLLIYDIFQEIVEIVLPNLEAIFINLKTVGGNITLNLQISHQGKDIKVISLRNFDKLNQLGGSIRETWEENEDTLYIIIKIPKGVDKYG